MRSRRHRKSPDEAVAPRHDPYPVEMEAERAGWYEMVRLVRRLGPPERLAPGYYRDPDWCVRDVVGHVGTWLAEAQVQLTRIGTGTYEGHDVDIDAMNAAFLAAMRDQPWEVAWVQATAGRTMMLQAWYGLRAPSEEAAWWIRKAGADHYTEHLGRLREWVEELLELRASAPPISSERGGGQEAP